MATLSFAQFCLVGLSLSAVIIGMLAFAVAYTSKKREKPSKQSLAPNIYAGRHPHIKYQ